MFSLFGCLRELRASVAKFPLSRILLSRDDLISSGRRLLIAARGSGFSDLKTNRHARADDDGFALDGRRFKTPIGNCLDRSVAEGGVARCHHPWQARSAFEINQD